MDRDVVGQVIIGIGYRGVVIEVFLAQITALHTCPNGILVRVEDAIDGGDVAPRGVGAEIDLARGEGEERDCDKDVYFFHDYDGF